MVMEGFNLPSSLKRGAFSILANGLSGLGSQGVPSTRDQQPISLFAPRNVNKFRFNEQAQNH
jgi:hypothetical protein